MVQKIVRKYGVVVLLYLAVIGGALLLSSRLRYLNNKEITMTKVAVTK